MNSAAPSGFRQSLLKLEGLKALLETQPYFSKVEISNGVVGFDLDNWRNNWHTGLNLADMVCSWLKLPHFPRAKPWILVEEAKPIQPVVIHRSPRYHNPSFPWKRVVEQYKHNLLFIGADLYEYADFCQRFGLVSYWHCKDYLEAAQIIKGSKLFIGNQSSPHMLAEAMKHNKVLESVPRNHWAWNCSWDRPNCIDVTDGRVTLPDLTSLL